MAPKKKRINKKQNFIQIMNILNPSGLVGAHKAQNSCTFNGLKHPDSLVYSNKTLKFRKKIVYDHAVSSQASLDIHNMVIHKWKNLIEKKANPVIHYMLVHIIYIGY